MDEVRKTRIIVIAVLAAIVVVVHVIAIRVFVIGGSAEKKETPAAAEKEAKQEEKKAVPAAPVKRGSRFFVKSSNPLFGAPLDFTSARHGNLPASLVPGCDGAGTGIIVDMDSRKVLWEKNSGKQVAIASMTKMMTMLLVMESMEKRDDLKLTDKITITKAARNVPRTGVLFLVPGEKFTIMELMIGTAVKSANDAATQLGEYFGGGSVERFVERMNSRAQELGLKKTVFYNPCGLPDYQNRNAMSSAADMVMLGEQLFQYPVLMQWCQMKQGSIRNGKTVFVNSNHLINPHYPGVDGLKTGLLKVAGRCLTFSVLRNGRRIVGCVTGFKKAQDRDRFCRKLIDWAYRAPAAKK